MQIDRLDWRAAEGWKRKPSSPGLAAADLVLYFGAPAALRPEHVEDLRQRYPQAALLGCSTGGEISESDVLDESIAAVAVRFSSTRVRTASEPLTAPEASEAVGARLAAALMADDLRCLFVLSDGTRVNGSALVRGLRGALPPQVVLTGGLAGDGDRFGSTLVGAGAAAPAPGVVAAVGLYGAALDVGHGSFGGWEPFGPERLITRSEGNVLHELDGQPALALYKRYLGPEAERLPASALLFPLAIRRQGARASDLVRTIVAVDEGKQSMTFAGDVPEGATAQLMRGTFNDLVDGAARAAEQAGSSAQLAVLVSCIGRKLLLGQRIADEVEAAGEVLGSACACVGFYSYGEISPHQTSGVCDLHNQTMTITTFTEH